MSLAFVAGGDSDVYSKHFMYLGGIIHFMTFFIFYVYIFLLTRYKENAHHLVSSDLTFPFNL